MNARFKLFMTCGVLAGLVAFITPEKFRPIAVGVAIAYVAVAVWAFLEARPNRRAAVR